jgi:hypothetical protein
MFMSKQGLQLRTTSPVPTSRPLEVIGSRDDLRATLFQTEVAVRCPVQQVGYVTSHCLALC